MCQQSVSRAAAAQRPQAQYDPSLMLSGDHIQVTVLITLHACTRSCWEGHWKSTPTHAGI